VQDGTYFARKYDLDYQIDQVTKRLRTELDHQESSHGQKEGRKRDLKRVSKLALLYKHL